jgi:hypothetical protein
VLLAACERGSGASGEALSRTERPAGHADAPAEWMLSAGPAVSMGEEGDGALFLVTSAVRTQDGGVVVANAGTGEMRWFDASGQPVRSAGRRGTGPGEFQHITWVGVLPGDSVAAWDPVLRRLSIFDTGGRFGRTLGIDAAKGPLPAVIGQLGPRALLLSSRIAVEPAANVRTWRDSVVLLRVALDNGAIDTLGRYPGMQWHAVARPGAGRVQAVPLGTNTIAAVADTLFYVGTGEGYALTAYGLNATPRAVVRKPYQPVRLTGEDRDAFLAAVVHVGGSARDRDERARTLADAPFPEALPPYTSALADPAGNLWVREPQRPSSRPERSQWSVFDPAGRWMATVRGPGRFKAFQVGTDWILGTQSDSADVERVLIYRLQKS